MKDKGFYLLIGLGGIVLFIVLFLLRQAGDNQVVTLPPVPTLAANGRSVYTLTADSEARFTLNEILRGVPTTVVGTTSLVDGQIALNLDDLRTAELSPMQIAAIDLATDNNMRNNAIRVYILYTDSYPTITFTPTSVTGLPAQAAVGEQLAFTVTGDLTIIGISHEVTFEVTAVAETPERITGTASATIDRTDWEIAIPRVQGVADVDENVLLELDFTAQTDVQQPVNSSQ